MKIKPCPFCGEPTTVEPWHGGPPTKTMVSCTNEACPAGMVHVCRDAEGAAVAAWNRRSPLSQETVERLKRAIADGPDLQYSGNVRVDTRALLRDILTEIEGKQS